MYVYISSHVFLRWNNRSHPQCNLSSTNVSQHQLPLVCDSNLTNTNISILSEWGKKDCFLLMITIYLQKTATVCTSQCFCWWSPSTYRKLTQYAPANTLITLITWKPVWPVVILNMTTHRSGGDNAWQWPASCADPNSDGNHVCKFYTQGKLHNEKPRKKPTTTCCYKEIQGFFLSPFLCLSDREQDFFV